LLAGNDIRVVEDDAFAVARHWDDRVERHLAMSSCNLRHVSAGALRSLSRLRSLRLADNPQLPRGDVVAAVQAVDGLTKLDLSSTSVFQRSHDLSQLFYDVWVGLEELVASGNGIRTLSANISTTRVVATLRSLDLSRNELTTLDDGLSALRRLEHLSVKANRLRVIDGAWLTGLDRLTTFDASYNELVEVGDGALRPLSRLRRLNLAGNQLGAVSATALPPSVEFLSLRNNHLLDVRFLAGLSHLRSLDVSANGIRRLDARLFSGHIRRFAISANFSRNEISSIDARAFAGVAFSVLDLSGNQLSRLSMYAANSSNVLRADDNIISDVDEQVFHATRDLHLANNRLTFLRCGDNITTKLLNSSSLHTAAQAEASSSQILVLDVSGNRNLGLSFHSQHSSCSSLVGLDQLEVLRARRVGIRRLSVSLLDRLTSLRVVDLADNEIGAIHSQDLDAAAVTRLHELDLSDNRLTNLSTLAASLSWHVERMSTVNLANNPWRCLCSDVKACRRLSVVLQDAQTRRRTGKRFSPRCASTDVSAASTGDKSKSVFEFCRDLVIAFDSNRTTALDCLQPRGAEQRAVERTTTFRTLSIIFIAVVLLAVVVSLACHRLSRRYTLLRTPARRTAASTRKNGYRIVGETALDFTDVQ